MTLYEFYGKECPHCKKMKPLVENLKEEGFDVQQREVWHDEENAALLDRYDDELCGGVPFFYNTESEQWLCGETSFEKLVAWAEGDEV